MRGTIVFTTIIVFTLMRSTCSQTTCSPGSTPVPGSASVELIGPFSSTGGTSAGTFSDGPGVYQNLQSCTWTIRSTTPVTVSLASLELESVYDVLYMQACSAAGECDAIPRESWGTGASTQEIALLSGAASAGAANRAFRVAAPDPNTIGPAVGTAASRLCGPAVKPTCLAAYDGYSGPNEEPPYVLYTGRPGSGTKASNFFDGDDNFGESMDGPSSGYSNWIRIDFSGMVAVSKIVLWVDGSAWNHQYFESYYARNVNVYASSTPSFVAGSAVKCAGPFVDLWWTQTELAANRACRSPDHGRIPMLGVPGRQVLRRGCHGVQRLSGRPVQDRRDDMRRLRGWHVGSRRGVHCVRKLRCRQVLRRRGGVGMHGVRCRHVLRRRNGYGVLDLRGRQVLRRDGRYGCYCLHGVRGELELTGRERSGRRVQVQRRVPGAGRRAMHRLSGRPELQRPGMRELFGWDVLRRRGRDGVHGVSGRAVLRRRCHSMLDDVDTDHARADHARADHASADHDNNARADNASTDHDNNALADNESTDHDNNVGTDDDDNASTNDDNARTDNASTDDDNNVRTDDDDNASTDDDNARADNASTDDDNNVRTDDDDNANTDDDNNVRTDDDDNASTDDDNALADNASTDDDNNVRTDDDDNASAYNASTDDDNNARTNDDDNTSTDNASTDNASIHNASIHNSRTDQKLHQNVFKSHHVRCTERPVIRCE
jgi:hypothetical protein